MSFSSTTLFDMETSYGPRGAKEWVKQAGLGIHWPHAQYLWQQAANPEITSAEVILPRIPIEQCEAVHYDDPVLRRECEFVSAMQEACESANLFRHTCTMSSLQSKCRQIGMNTAGCDDATDPRKFTRVMKQNLTLCRDVFLDYYVVASSALPQSTRTQNWAEFGRELRSLLRDRFAEKRLAKWSYWANKWFGEGAGEMTTERAGAGMGINCRLCSSRHVLSMQGRLQCFANLPPYDDYTSEANIASAQRLWKSCVQDCKIGEGEISVDTCMQKKLDSDPDWVNQSNGSQNIVQSQNAERFLQWRNRMQLSQHLPEFAENWRQYAQRSLQEKVSKLQGLVKSIQGDLDIYSSGSQFTMWNYVKSLIKEKKMGEALVMSRMLQDASTDVEERLEDNFSELATQALDLKPIMDRSQKHPINQSCM